MDLDGKTLVRIYKDKKGRIVYNSFLDDRSTDFEIIGALETVKHYLLRDMEDTQQEVPKEDVEKIRRLLDG